MEQFESLIKEATEQLAGPGAFLMTGEPGKTPNVMTIGWAQWGRVWGKPICEILVRTTRHSFSLLENNGLFTVSVPLNGAMKSELGVCGRVSGRDSNKVEQLGLKLLPSRVGGIDALEGCTLHFECRVVAKSDMDPKMTDPAVMEQFYSPIEKNVLHRIYFGEILAAYRT